MRNRGLVHALVLGALMLCLAPAVASAATTEGAVVSNGTVQLGVTKYGDLNYNCSGSGDTGCPANSSGGTSLVGLRYVALNTEATADGCPCEGWGAADAGSGLTGYANVGNGTLHVTPVSIVATATTVVVTDDVTDGAHPGYALRVVHDYHPSTISPNLYEVRISITNTGTNAVTDLRYRRVMDWDVEPTPYNEWVTIANTAASPQLRFDSDIGGASANALAGRSYATSQIPCGTGYTGTCEFSNLGSGGVYPTVTHPVDHGAMFDFGFGALAVGQTRTFQTYYGAAPSRAVALSQIAAQGIGVYSLGEPDCGANGNTGGACAGVGAFGGVVSGLPNTFTFGFLTSDVDLSVTAGAAPAVVLTGGQTAESFTVRNNGPDATPDAKLTIPLPAGVSFVSAVPTQGSCSYSAPNVVCSFGWLANGATASATLTTTLSQAGTFSLAAIASAPGNDASMANNSISMSLLAADVLVQSTPTAAPAASPAVIATPTAAAAFMVQVVFTVPMACKLPCKAKAQFFVRGGEKLGVRNGLSIDAKGQVRFLVPVDKAVLLAASGVVDRHGYRVTQTRLVVATRNANGRWSTTVKLGRIAVAVGRLASGKTPSVAGRVF
jgi:uncharacterized repeat protein (TIGR01451 family)